MQKFSLTYSIGIKPLIIDWAAGKLRKAYNDRFFNEEKQYYENNTPTANLLSLSLGFCGNR